MQLSPEEALAKAREMWGSDAWVLYDSTRYIPYVVGLNSKEFGVGRSWQEAFDEAFLREKGVLGAV